MTFRLLLGLAVALIVPACSDSPTAPSPLGTAEQHYAASAQIVARLLVTSLPLCGVCGNDKEVTVAAMTINGQGVGYQRLTLTILSGDGQLAQTDVTTDVAGVAHIGLRHTSEVVVDAAHSQAGHYRLRIPLTGFATPDL